ncbi:MAG TPA: energy transducer TonB [Frateuria sp.]|uniref:energy transducer TonB n=1 Tax=Frateuria sp. TaxID=2211372 RepID=UPI002D801D76|nr:energy transducer TonB [Frateuria sp.]HET6806167.1 energy transducer TonB [Frateuria sp.]
MSVSFAPPRRRWAVAATVLALLLVTLVLNRRAPALAPPDDAASGRGILLGLAQAAERDHRLLAPAGSNAYEFYLSVLGLEPDDAATREALQRLFPAGTRVVEQSIDDGELDEAERELRLLRDFDADNYLLALLAGKLAAERQLAVRRHEARAAILRAQLARPAVQPAR